MDDPYINALYNFAGNTVSYICQRSNFATLLAFSERVLSAPAFGNSGANILAKWFHWRNSAPSIKEVGQTA
jgi:hypothetical protein